MMCDKNQILGYQLYRRLGQKVSQGRTQVSLIDAISMLTLIVTFRLHAYAVLGGLNLDRSTVQTCQASVPVGRTRYCYLMRHAYRVATRIKALTFTARRPRRL